MLGGELYNAMDPVLYAERIRAKELLYDYNHTRPSEKEIRERILRELLGSTGNDFLIEQPFNCDYGYNIRIGENFYANVGCTILDVAPVTIGDNVMLAPNVTTDATVAAIQNAAGEEVSLYQSDVPAITGEILSALRTTGRSLIVLGEDYTLRIDGTSIKSTQGGFSTALTFAPDENGLSFQLGESGALPCVVQITLTGENAAYSRLYLHNTASEKWQFLNSYKDGTITADTAGSYLLTNQNLRFTNINWTFFIAAGALTVVCLIVYIAVKKRYWFW